VGYEGIYKVSNHGRVFSFQRIGNRKDRILKLFKTHKGLDYLSVSLNKNGSSKTSSIHRLVATAFIENPEGKAEVNHLDGKPSNNYVSNLEWVSRSQNILHAYAIGLNSAKGGRNNRHILTDREVSFMRYICGFHPEIKSIEISNFYGLPQTHIRSILCFRAWKDDI
jgi:hypothetical protein